MRETTSTSGKYRQARSSMPTSVNGEFIIVCIVESDFQVCGIL